MFITANDLSKWENFRKGLKVLLLLNGDDDGDGFSAAETRSKLESTDYIVTTFTDETEALSAVFKNPESFHIAIVEVNTNAEKEGFKFLEAAKDVLPTIMISTDHCITTTMKCIALGAVEFLQKPLSPEKLKNIWQHVVHKAFNDGGSKPVKESVVSMLHLDTNMTIDEKDPAPSTPQLKQVSRLGDCQENINCSMENVNSSTEKDNMEDQDIGESKSVDTTNRILDDNKVVVKEERGDSEKEEQGETGDLESERTDLVNCHKKEDDSKPVNKSSKNLSGNKTTRKKVDWTPELHKKFVQAVEQLGIEQAIPSRILELMKVNTLTRHNVASHLQKYRMHRKNSLPKDDHNQRWAHSRENQRPIQRNINGFQQQQRPVMAYPVWGLPSIHHPPRAIPPLWPPPLHCAGQPPPWHWKPPYPTVNGNAWGCPVGQPITGSYYTPNITAGGYQYTNGVETGFKMMPATQPDEEMLDQVVKEAISKPWMPLPLGLKPPSPESVLAELSRQGIPAVPSSSSSFLINGSHRIR
ncbi:PREDICTED: two-component response regulator-like APRR2 isoform X1 [Camelina sativa]|uniref:Two-component response regulator-like APRR2 isoform X1 n=1 Tax=Camelina sativa TaxID=90675 RepID=A0ABM0U1T5_CAMSA|nr:PREDICTED: two-component response regulator-like APRR2 isoform X2 [Camelina sativa]XP_019086835.1 PREDICTED: two-component response regulator-like APRR2 isoform X1 [Camelina sativa]